MCWSISNNLMTWTKYTGTQIINVLKHFRQFNDFKEVHGNFNNFINNNDYRSTCLQKCLKLYQLTLWLAMLTTYQLEIYI